MKKILSLTLAFVLLLIGCKSAESDTSGSNSKKAQQESNYADNVTYANMLFEITLPRELAEIAEVETLDDQINVYYKEAKDAGFGGLAFFICAYEHPDDYAGGPFVKVGELSNQDAVIYDVLKGYATEIQWDYNVPDMPEGYGKLYDAADSVIESMVGNHGFTYIHGAGTKGEDLYNTALSDIVKECNDSDKSLDSIGYAYADINTDGIDELFIGDLTDADLSGTAVDIYTMVNHRPEHVVSRDANDRFYNYENCFVAKEWGDSTKYGIDIYNIEPNTTDMIYQFGYIYDASTDPDNPWFKTYDGNEMEPLSEEEFTSEVESLRSQYVSFDFKPLSENEDAIAGANIPQVDN